MFVMSDQPSIKHSPKPMLVDCPECEQPVIGEPRGHLFYYEPEEGPPERWTLLACQEKKHPILVIQNEYSGATFDEDRPWRMYPPQDRHLSSEIPEALRKVHEEARACLRAKAYTAATVMAGRTLEGAAQLHGVKGNNLQQSLSKMRDEGHIDGRLWEWAQTLRHVRNIAAHFNDDAITKQDAEDALAFSEALLDYLYVLTARFNAMKERRSKGPSASST